eukprot:3432218-Rhodomonas_salina.3
MMFDPRSAGESVSARFRVRVGALSGWQTVVRVYLSLIEEVWPGSRSKRFKFQVEGDRRIRERKGGYGMMEEESGTCDCKEEEAGETRGLGDSEGAAA